MLCRWGQSCRSCIDLLDPCQPRTSGVYKSGVLTVLEREVGIPLAVGST